jgi:hypothetical protein
MMAVIGWRSINAARINTAVADSAMMVTTPIRRPCTKLFGPRSTELYKSVTGESTLLFHVSDIRESKLEEPTRTSSSANFFTETQDRSVENTVRKVKSATTKRRVGPPEEISIDSPPPEAVNTFDT